MRTLLIDTCGETGSVALADGESIVAASELPPRTASSALLDAVVALLVEAHWNLDSLEAVGVVNGPGSFTGVRVGLAAAKGLCEARNLPLAAVSRLEVLAESADLQRGYAVLDAGRGELYVRHIDRSGSARESVMKVEDLLKAVHEAQVSFRDAGDKQVVIAEESLLRPLGALQPELVPVVASAALPAVSKRLEEGGDDLASIDANYVRGEQEIYGNKSAAGSQGSAS